MQINARETPFYVCFGAPPAGSNIVIKHRAAVATPSRRARPGHVRQTTHCTVHVRFGSKADMCAAKWHVRFTPESDIKCDIVECPLWANSGLRLKRA